MAKRKSYGGEGNHAGKRQKTAHVHEPPTSEDVHTARQLCQLLTFEQDLRKARHGLQSFKNLLDSIANDEADGPGKKQIVLEFLEIVKPKDQEDEVPVYLPDIMETWGMASQMNNENVMSAVPVVLALLLRMISEDVDMASYGLGICRTLLQKRQQELLAKNLSADKGKDFIISPTLRLLREATCLDGGAFAAPIFRARNNTFKSLARNMGLRFLGDGIENPQRPSVRTNAIRFFLSNLRLLHVEAKRDLLSQKDIVASLMRHLREDPPSLIYEILDALKSSVVQDKKLSKDIKIKILNAHSLTRIASLYGYSRDPEDAPGSGRLSVEEAAHELLVAACTDHNAGICRSERGYYPDGVDPDTLMLGADASHRMDFGIDSIPWMSKFDDTIPVRNMLLAEFIQSLRPWSSTKQNELLVSIFGVSPELIAYYFLQKKTFTFDPKLSATWMGYAALLYNVVQLPIPAYFGHANSYASIPPPTSVVLGNLIPPPMTLKALTRCLSNKSKLVSFYAIRMLVLSLQKLGRALEMYREAASSSNSIWDEAARRLTDEFYQRIPDLKDIITCYRGMTDDDLLQREAVSRLISLYYEVIPQLALKAKFDVSPMLLTTIKKVESSNGNDEDVAMSLLELEHLCDVAKYSPSMRWFAKTTETPNSPFITLFRVYIEKTTGLSADRLCSVLCYVADEHQLVESRGQSGGLTPLIEALKNIGVIDPVIWTFLDNCMERCARTPIKYLEMIEEQLENTTPDEYNDKVTCPLMMAIAEQLPYLVSTSPGRSVLKSLAQFLSEYLGSLRVAGISKTFLKGVKGMLISGIGDKKIGAKISILDKPKPKSQGQTNLRDSHTDATSSPTMEINGGIAPNKTTHMSEEELENKLSVPVITSKENSLLRWSSKTPEELIEEGYATSLIVLLSSEHPSIRKEALTNVIKMASKIKESAYEENEQVWLLLMELAESARDSLSEAPLPSVIVVFACKALDVLKNPLHPLYEKVNRFLTSSPTWSLDNVPLIQNILQEGPTEDGAYYSELSWLLSFLLDSLRTPQDVALFHKRKVFEKVLSLASNPYMGPNLRSQVLRIIYRATTIEGGSNTIITRFGAISWLVAQKAATIDAGERELYQALVRRLWETCDQKRISAWSQGGVEKLAVQE
ncbi:ribosome 60S biogenesis N-terminal-domain-containing protein [Biscogniauxia sp. FL1348]|nr:ribosome 60S biogenesis N-terminal-domain-containing protein [Biscogniauxia sp. FL1348]